MAGQGAQAEDTAVPDQLPAGHCWQAAALVAPGRREKAPAPHAVQACAAAAPLQDPGLHCAHTLAEVAPVAAE